VPKLLRFEIKNFKSLANFSLHFSETSSLTCLVGLNGSGKSTILQAIDFAAQMFRGNVTEWLRYRGWSSKDIPHKPSARRIVDISMTCVLDDQSELTWVATFNPTYMRCTEEVFRLDGTPIFSVKDKAIRSSSTKPIEFQYQGSILSQLNPDMLAKINTALVEFKKFVAAIHSFDLLSPHLLKQRARDGENIGIGGERLSAFLHTLSPAALEEISSLARKFHPNSVTFSPRSMQYGWKSLYMRESLAGGVSLDTESRHMNDGALRILAVLAELFSSDTVLLFDEIENGFNPSVAKQLVSLLTSATRQVIVTTHSPLILNYLDDTTAEDSVVLIYRTRNGSTQAQRFFDLPQAKERLPHMSPGEVFLDVDVEDALHGLSAAAVPEDF
jgi:predicted ATPase